MFPAIRSARGSTLILAMIMLVVLSAVGVAAVLVSSEERINASRQARYEAFVECANAAQAKLWSLVGANGINYITNTSNASGQVVTSLTLPDGTDLLAPAHYGTASGDSPTLPGFGCLPASSSTGITGGDNMTNTIMEPTSSGCASGGAIWAVARCRDPNQLPDGKTYREHEVEVSFRYAL